MEFWIKRERFTTIDLLEQSVDIQTWFMFCYVTLLYIILHYVVVMLHYVILLYIILHNVGVMLHYANLLYITLC
jgi:hypothetical protein